MPLQNEIEMKDMSIHSIKTSKQKAQTVGTEPIVEFNIENTKKDETKKQPINVIEPKLQNIRTTDDTQKVAEVEDELFNDNTTQINTEKLDNQQVVMQKELDLFTQEVEKFLKNYKVLYQVIKDGEQDVKRIEATVEEVKIFLKQDGLKNDNILELQIYFSRIERHFRRQDLLNMELSFSSIAGLVTVEFENLVKPVIEDIKLGISNIQKNAQNLVKLLEEIRQNPVAVISDIIVREINVTIQFVTNLVTSFVRDLANLFDFNINLQMGGAKISFGTDAFRSNMEDIFGKGSMELPPQAVKQSFWIEKRETASDRSKQSSDLSELKTKVKEVTNSENNGIEMKDFSELNGSKSFSKY